MAIASSMSKEKWLMNLFFTFSGELTPLLAWSSLAWHVKLIAKFFIRLRCQFNRQNKLNVFKTTVNNILE